MLNVCQNGYGVGGSFTKVCEKLCQAQFKIGLALENVLKENVQFSFYDKYFPNALPNKSETLSINS
jgi:hypothetical protein